jgi:hypothetical protein
MLFVLDLKAQVVYILDPIPIGSSFTKQPVRKYLNKIQRASTVLGILKAGGMRIFIYGIIHF